ncbi:hypothetical protein OG204_18025 [Streptomyces sp. NBC_01387]|uniref:DUF7144 family membrane protein n=1 Tax=unclassified Streptomyces TaxID=2593676 RepID=UPI002024D2C7|nr:MULTISPECIES: hypothetical protein [unclassified Streptomyces]MCX4549739.1 hypothetical protein [Streptomyces sp. NBC_01500]WSC21263.1 hypothetical protein OIE60_17100 [Streptomyces sp. NBC_01766]WSV55199.1 hypothetical protein OG282_16675 [Streptomyces sp. NBC_01014]
MSHQTAEPHHSTTPHSGWAAGGTMFAGVLMLVEGVTDILQGIVAIAKDSVYTHVNNYTYAFSLTSWGWIHLILGILVALTGLGILAGVTAARAAGIVLASLNVILQFMFLPYQPLWALTGIAIGLFVIWSLAFGDRTGRAHHTY